MYRPYLKKVGKIKSHSQLDTRPHLRRNNRIKSIHSSLKIEANSLSLSEVRDVINGRTVLGDMQEIQEVKNAYKAYEQIEKINPYSLVNGDSDLFIEFMLEQIDKILDEVTQQLETSNLDISEYVKRMLSVMEYDIPYTTVAIMEKLGIKSRETFRKNYMNPAIKAGMVEMTMPDKPNNRNQRYIKR